MAHLATTSCAPARAFNTRGQRLQSTNAFGVRPTTCGWHPVPAPWSPAIHAPQRRAIITAATKPGGSVLDAPVLPGYEKSTSNERKFPPSYKVMLHNDNYNRREYVVKTLLKVIKELTVDDAVTAMNEAHETGVAMVVTCPQEDAERYCEGLRLNGLTSSIEPGR